MSALLRLICTTCLVTRAAQNHMSLKLVEPCTEHVVTTRAGAFSTEVALQGGSCLSSVQKLQMYRGNAYGTMSESEPKRPSVLVDTPMQAAGGSQVSHAAQGTPHSLPGLLPDDEADSDLLLGSENSSALDRHIHSIRVQPIQDISLPFTTGDSVSDAVLAPFEPKETPCFYILNVVWLSICFSLVEGSILVVLAFETSINHDLGVYSSAALYIAFTVGAIPAPLVLHILRPKYSLVAGLSLYCLYIGANMVPHWGTLMPVLLSQSAGARELLTFRPSCALIGRYPGWVRRHIPVDSSRKLYHVLCSQIRATESCWWFRLHRW